MSTYTSEPGTRLAGRYRLVDQVNAGAGWTYWKALDETLARPVTVLTFAAGFPRIAETVAAARAASRLGDPRFSQVFDVENAGELAYVVLEWVVGESLLDMLAEGPLDPPRAAALVAEAALAIAAAHRVGLAHLRLDPACLRWTPGGGVKITGLGVDAALTGSGPFGLAGSMEDPEFIDTRDLARLLYAAVTGYWPRCPAGAGPPGSPGPGPWLLPPAPETDRVPCTPRQVSAGVPAGLDDVTCRALFQRPSRHGPALTTATMFADALASAAPPVPLQVPPPAARPAPDSRHTPPFAGGPAYPGGASPYPGPGPAAPTRADPIRRPPAEHSTAARAVLSAVIVLVLAAAGVAAWSVSRSLHREGAAPPRLPSSSPSAAAAVLLKPVSATSYDTVGSDDPTEAPNAIDGSTSTAWHTSYYVGCPVFGGLKKGAGLLIDMGRP
ncbi:MAG: protein kinase family protein, partial [Actinobacteria bacterium]|nr:protein kinase family protein [Actinomycetota bacterium]